MVSPYASLLPSFDIAKMAVMTYLLAPPGSPMFDLISPLIDSPLVALPARFTIASLPLVFFFVRFESHEMHTMITHTSSLPCVRVTSNHEK